MAVSPEPDDALLPGSLAETLLPRTPDVEPATDVLVDPTVVDPLLASDVISPPPGGADVATTTPGSARSALDAFGAMASGSRASGEAAASGAFGEMGSIEGRAIVALLQRFGAEPAPSGEGDATSSSEDADAFTFPPASTDAMDDSPLDPYLDAIDPVWLSLLAADPEFASLVVDDVAALVQLDVDLHVVSPDAPDGWVV